MTERVPGRTCLQYSRNTGGTVLEHGDLISMGREARRICRETGAHWRRRRGQSRYPDAVLAAAFAVVVGRRS